MLESKGTRKKNKHHRTALCLQNRKGKTNRERKHNCRERKKNKTSRDWNCLKKIELA